MKSVLFLVLIGFATVFADFYFCPKENGDAFECYEYAPQKRTCLTNGRRGEAHVVCSQCKKQWEYCVTRGHIVESKYPERDCGADYKNTPCTADNTHWSTVFEFRRN